MRFLVISLLALYFPNNAFAQLRQDLKQTYTFSRQEAIDLVNQLLSGINPSDSENAYMSAMMKQKIQWVFDGFASKKLVLLFVEDQRKELGSVLMYSGYDNNLPFIRIVADRLLILIRIQQKVSYGFNRKQKNTFALALIHEAVHLENTIEQFKKPRSKEEFIREEFRTYKKVDKFAVSDLLRKNEPIDIDFLEIHEVLKKCGSVTTCKAFTDYYTSHNQKNSIFPK